MNEKREVFCGRNQLRSPLISSSLTKLDFFESSFYTEKICSPRGWAITGSDTSKRRRVYSGESEERKTTECESFCQNDRMLEAFICFHWFIHLVSFGHFLSVCFDHCWCHSGCTAWKWRGCGCCCCRCRRWQSCLRHFNHFELRSWTKSRTNCAENESAMKDFLSSTHRWCFRYNPILEDLWLGHQKQMWTENQGWPDTYWFFPTNWGVEQMLSSNDATYRGKLSFGNESDIAIFNIPHFHHFIKGRSDQETRHAWT